MTGHRSWSRSAWSRLLWCCGGFPLSEGRGTSAPGPRCSSSSVIWSGQTPEPMRSAATVCRSHQQDGGRTLLDAVARARRCEDRVAAGQRDALEGGLLDSGPRTGSGTRALAVRLVPHRVAAEWPGQSGAHQQAAANCASPLWSHKRTCRVGGRHSEMSQKQDQR